MSPFGGVALGPGPIYPTFVADAAQFDSALRGILLLTPAHYGATVNGFYSVKTLWFADPAYTGPLLIRGQQLDGPHPLGFGEATPPVTTAQIPPGPGVNMDGPWRNWPGATYVLSAGCYGWQIDGDDFSYVVIFRAVMQ